MSLASRQLRRSSGVSKQFKMTGLSELQASLDKLPGKLRENALKNASAAGARLIRNEAKRIVSVDSGTLRDSIVVARTYKSGGRRRNIRGGVVVGIRGVGRYYSHLVEYGSSKLPARPFMRPALQNMAQKALKVMGEKLGKEILRATKKLSGWHSAKDIKRLTR